jgi:hypothetical protein
MTSAKRLSIFRKNNIPPDRVDKEITPVAKMLATPKSPMPSKDQRKHCITQVIGFRKNNHRNPSGTFSIPYATGVTQNHIWVKNGTANLIS